MCRAQDRIVPFALIAFEGIKSESFFDSKCNFGRYDAKKKKKEKEGEGRGRKEKRREGRDDEEKCGEDHNEIIFQWIRRKDKRKTPLCFP